MSSPGMNNPLAVAKIAGTKVTENIKSIAITGAVIGGLYLAYKIYKNAFPGGLEVDTRKPDAQISNSQAQTIAERLYQAMYASGTDEESIYAALAGLNHNDFIKVSRAFGRRSYMYLAGEAPIFDWMGADLTLVEWMIQELSGDEINKVKEFLPDIF
jgi:hypothetical protein